jgi:pyruvate,water dikinase
MSAPAWWRRLKDRLFGSTVKEEDAEAARGLVQTRYHSLRLLLAANTRALEAMATMEQAAADGSTFGMPSIRSHCTAIGVNVFKMVRNLDVLAPGKYSLLLDRLEEIEHRIDTELAAIPISSEVPLVLPMTDVVLTHLDVAGSKMASLGEVCNEVGLTVPDGFVITTAAYERLITTNDLQPEIDRLIQTYQSDELDDLFILSSKLQQLILAAEIPADVVAAINEAAERVDERAVDTSYALRSSALGEDSAGASFAGQYESLLNVRRTHLAESYLEVIASKYTPQAMQYRKRRGLRDDHVAMSVGCLVMVDARSGGVAYSGNPGDHSDPSIHISSAWGLPKTIVDGRFAADLFVVERGDELKIRATEIGDKTHRFMLHHREGVRRVEVDEGLRRAPSLTDQQAMAVARTAIRLEQHFGSPVDVEWALTDDSEVVVLQCRPLSQSSSTARHDPPSDAPPPLISGGVNASPGAAAGIVHRVSRDADALSFPQGAVLVLSQPLPRWAALLDRTAAVVAEEGGVAGHLATVAREVGVPAILGAGSLDTLEDGQEITVDATGRSVYPGRIEALLRLEEAASVDVPDSPVRTALKKALAHIAPLNLIDPDSLDFKPANCQTMHDITRFCHEQAVREVFTFGSDTEFPQYASKQLHHNVPMQWWVLDLGNGFKAPVTGKYIHLEDIVCTPMHALWDGMVAIPWDGPPAASGRGLGSVLFQATANPALSNPFRKPYANRNYFIISKHFMNLQSRFGFHFTTVEALAGERPEENYLSFTFKGGAADHDRRAGRARFIGDLLAERDFQIRVTQDVVTARRTHLAHGDVEDGVRVVGYLLMHTRQLDIIMGDKRAVEHYRAKMRADISSLTPS